MSIVLRKKKKNAKFIIVAIVVMLLLAIIIYFTTKKNEQTITGLKQIDYMNSGGQYINPCSYITITPTVLSPNVIGTTYDVTIEFTNEDFESHHYQIEYGVGEKLSSIEITKKNTNISIPLTEEGLNTKFRSLLCLVFTVITIPPYLRWKISGYLLIK